MSPEHYPKLVREVAKLLSTLPAQIVQADARGKALITLGKKLLNERPFWDFLTAEVQNKGTAFEVAPDESSKKMIQDYLDDVASVIAFMLSVEDVLKYLAGKPDTFHHYAMHQVMNEKDTWLRRGWLENASGNEYVFTAAGRRELGRRLPAYAEAKFFK